MTVKHSDERIVVRFGAVAPAATARMAAAAFVALACAAPAAPEPGPAPAKGAEARVVDYLKANVRPGEAIVVSDLYNRVFTAPEERAVLDRLFNVFFKLPLAIAQQLKATGRPPTLAQLSEQFRFTVPGEADVMLRIMDSDPRMPRFLTRDAASGEITHVDVAAILADPRFGRLLERTIGGWQGRPAPAFAVTALDGTLLRSSDLAGKPHLVYFWFSGCPPCLRTAPLLAALLREYAPRGFEIVALNADRALELQTSDEERVAYVREHAFATHSGDASPELLQAYGSVSVFPSFFFVDRHGLIVEHAVAFQERQRLEAAVRRALE